MSKAPTLIEAATKALEWLDNLAPREGDVFDVRGFMDKCPNNFGRNALRAAIKDASRVPATRALHGFYTGPGIPARPHPDKRTVDALAWADWILSHPHLIKLMKGRRGDLAWAGSLPEALRRARPKVRAALIREERCRRHVRGPVAPKSRKPVRV